MHLRAWSAEKDSSLQAGLLRQRHAVPRALSVILLIALPANGSAADNGYDQFILHLIHHYLRGRPNGGDQVACGLLSTHTRYEDLARTEERALTSTFVERKQTRICPPAY